LHILVEIYNQYPPTYEECKFKNLKKIKILSPDFNISLTKLTKILNGYLNIKEIAINEKTYLYSSRKLKEI